MKVKFFNVIYPGKGYRLLNIGETFLSGDEVSLMVGREDEPTKRNWFKVGDSMIGQKINEPTEEETIRPYGYYRRKIAN